MCASIISKLGVLDHRNAPFSDDDPVVLYYFFSYTETEPQVCTMVATLIKQLLRTRLDQDRTSRILEQAYDNDNSTQCESLNTLWAVFCNIVEDFPNRVYVILDGLDECSDEDRRLFMEKLSQSSDSCETRFFIASRPEPDIRKVLKGRLDLEDLDVDTRSDIQVFVDDRIFNGNLEDRLGQYRDEIIQKILGTSDSMFRYAALMLDELSNQTGEQTIPEILAQLPKGLNEMYDRLLKRLNNGDSKMAKLRQVTLFLLLGQGGEVVRTTCFISYANAVKLGESNFNPKSHVLATSEDIESACGLLIGSKRVSDGKANLVSNSIFTIPPFFGSSFHKLSHRTVEEYLVSHMETLYNIHPFAGNIRR